VELGRRPYPELLELQRDLCRRRLAGEVAEDVLLLVEHDPVVTLGRGTRAASLPLPPAQLERQGIPVFEVERGGDVTYHGPGQLVGYPIVDLGGHRRDLHWYLRTLEDALVLALGRLGIEAERRPGLTGVWTSGRKIASIGIHVKQWVTFHGFALNVTTDLRAFELIVPCGIDGVVMTSVAEELVRTDAAVLETRARAEVVKAFVETFGYPGVVRRDLAGAGQGAAGEMGAPGDGAPAGARSEGTESAPPALSPRTPSPRAP
jgi:lipoate-protein ligase B